MASIWFLFLLFCHLVAMARLDDTCTDLLGLVHQNGAHFSIKCRASCICQNRTIGCVSMCPPFNTMGHNCRPVYRENECCTQTICQDAAEAHKCTPAKQKLLPVPKKPTAGWQASVSICSEGSCSDKCSATILSPKWLITSAECLQNASRDAISVTVESEPHIRTVNAIHKHSLYGMGLIGLVQEIEFDKIIQPANLPISKQHCLNLIQDNCELQLPQLGKVVPENFCKKPVTSDPLAFLKKTFCVQSLLSKDACSIGREVVAKQRGRNYLVGVQTSCPAQQVFLQAIELCEMVGWIQEKTGLHRCNMGDTYVCTEDWD